MFRGAPCAGLAAAANPLGGADKIRECEGVGDIASDAVAMEAVEPAVGVEGAASLPARAGDFCDPVGDVV